jgi:outer membrane protein TolC
MRLYIVYFIVVCAGATLPAQTPLSLSEAIAIALENNYDVKIADREVLIAETNDSWARAGRAPTVDLQGTFNNNFIQDNNPASFLQGTFYTGNVGLAANANLLVYAGGRVKIAKDQLALSTTQSQLAKTSVVNDLIRAVYRQYYDVVLQQEQLAVLQQIRALSRDRLAYEEVRRDYGASNTYNLVQFESAVLADSINVVSQAQRVDVARLTLLNTLELPSTSDYMPEEQLSVAVEEISPEVLADQLVSDNPGLKTLEVNASLVALNKDLASAARKPTVSLFASLGFQENAFQFYGAEPGMGPPPGLLLSNRGNLAAGAQASWNLYDGGVLKANQQTAQLREDLASIQIEQAQADLLSQLDLLVSNYDQQRSLLELTVLQIDLSQRSLDISEERFKGGQITSLDYRNAQIQYVNAAFSRISAIYQLLLTKVDIDWLVGRYGE